MNASDLTGCRASFTDLSGIMKNLRNAFIYTASTRQRNGNFQQWLPYNALCLGQATPSHCILETMRPRAWAASSSHRGPGRSLSPHSIPLLPAGQSATPETHGDQWHVVVCRLNTQLSVFLGSAWIQPCSPQPGQAGGGEAGIPAGKMLVAQGWVSLAPGLLSAA